MDMRTVVQHAADFFLLPARMLAVPHSVAVSNRVQRHDQECQTQDLLGGTVTDRAVTFESNEMIDYSNQETEDEQLCQPFRSRPFYLWS